MANVFLSLKKCLLGIISLSCTPSVGGDEMGIRLTDLALTQFPLYGVWHACGTNKCVSI